MPRMRKPSVYETETLRRRAWVDWTIGEPDPLMDVFTIALVPHLGSNVGYRWFRFLSVMQNMAKHDLNHEVSIEAAAAAVERVPSLRRTIVTLRELLATGLIDYVDELGPITDYGEVVRVTEKGLQATYPDLPSRRTNSNFLS